LTQKPSILILVNCPSSALGIIGSDLKKFWNHDYRKARIDIDITASLSRQRANKYDILFPLYYIDAQQVEKFCDVDRIVTGIHSHYLWDGGQTRPDHDIEPPDELIDALRRYRRVNVVSKRLFHLFEPKINVMYTRCGYDPEIFFPDESQKRGTESRIVVGWVGNSSPKYHGGGKGFSDFIEPIRNILDVEQFVFSFANSRERQQDRYQMRDYYRNINVLLVTSREEGQPMPPVEAAGCAVPTVATNVGIIPELVEDGLSGYIVKRDVTEFVKCLNSSSKERLAEMGCHCLFTARREWTWNTVIHRWMDFMLGDL